MALQLVSLKASLAPLFRHGHSSLEFSSPRRVFTVHSTHTAHTALAKGMAKILGQMEPVLPAGEERRNGAEKRQQQQQLKSSFERDRNRSPKTRCQVAQLHTLAHTDTTIHPNP